MSDNLNTRQKALLKMVIETYIASAEPVGSKFLSEEGGFEVSGATLRNEMRELEEKGYLTHPHTSAGRIPTELGYKLYIKELMKPEVLSKKTQKGIEDALKELEGTERAKELAKYIAAYAGAAVIMAHHRDSLYYTGLSQLFSQPELFEQSHALNISTMFDQCEERVAILYRLVQEPVQVFVGTENPLGAACGTVVFRVGQRLVAILGPMRMNYAKIVGLSQYLIQS